MIPSTTGLRSVPGTRAAGATAPEAAAGASTRADLRQILTVLRGEFGTGSRWPADSGFEIMAGAVLVQRSSWRNAQRSLERLRRAGALDPAVMLLMDDGTLAGLIRPSGFMTGKARSLRALAAWVTSGPGRSATALDDETLRACLLALPGIGPETADVISLYAYHRPRFIWDAYARRMLSAAGYPVGRDYEATRARLEDALAGEALSAAEHQELHWLVVTAGGAVRAEGWERYLDRLLTRPGPGSRRRPEQDVAH
ncbi:endonuclease III domain-containing protein [Actinomyces bowdenii]|uniref:Base excision DNA repair protein n=1 Tax=Actinomyces bowdenii TaxID=131109 RepID=A0A3P1V707_9ACTO|nr:base excision DNA repair protein [Actinomyces bowdenii]RRD29446.1 base excision DNA repair protein [Actinomyces bowdenii]